MNQETLMRLFGALGIVGALGCEPITYSREAAIDFARYRTAAVRVDGSNPKYGSYLVTELQDVSGFEDVFLEPATADVHLSVSIDVQIVTTVDSEGNGHVDYEGAANYVAVDQSGVELLSGDESDSSFGYDETAEDVLDQVAQQFMAPYRI